MALRKKHLILLAAAAVAVGLFSLKGHHKPPLLNTTEDCLKGRDAAVLAGGVMDTMNSPPKPGCPGYEAVTEGDIGTYKLGPYTFEIPRDYLWQGKYKEGKVEGLYFYIEYPSMKPAIKQFSEPGYQNELHVTLKYNNKCPEMPCNSYVQHGYDAWVLQKQKMSTYVSEQPIFSKEYDLNQYSFQVGNPAQQHEVYFVGDPQRPDDWYLCRSYATSPDCKTIYKLSEGLWVEVSYGFPLFKNHADIRDRLNKTLNSFIREK